MLPCDQIPKERPAIGDLAGPLDDELGLMNVNLAIWMARDDSKADASVTRAGNQVTDSIDTMLRQLHMLRARMVAEKREHQDLAAARADELLARARELRQEEAPSSACPDHRPVLDDAAGWYCPACGSGAPPDAGGDR